MLTCAVEKSVRNFIVLAKLLDDNCFSIMDKKKGRKMELGGEIQDSTRSIDYSKKKSGKIF